MLPLVMLVMGYGKELVVCSFLHDFSKRKGSSLDLIYNAYTALLLYGAVSQTIKQIVSTNTVGCPSLVI